MESPFYSMIELAVENHYPNDNVVEFTEEEEEEEEEWSEGSLVTFSYHSKEESQLGSKGEGWTPIEVESLLVDHDFKSKRRDVGRACVITKQLCEKSSVIAASKKELKVAISPSTEQSVVCSTSGANCSLDMVNVSNPT